MLIQRPEIRDQRSEGFKSLQSGSRVGTSSLRRIAQLKAIRSDLEYLDLRGNIDTRIKKLEEGKYDAIVVAYAGIKRLGLEDKITEHLNPLEILPAVGQGVLAIEIKEDDQETENIVLKLNDRITEITSITERAFLEEMQGGCQIPIGVYSEIRTNDFTLHAMVSALDGSKIIMDKITINHKEENPKNKGKLLAKNMLTNGAREILKDITEKTRI